LPHNESIDVALFHDAPAEAGQQHPVPARIVVMETILACHHIEGNRQLIDPVPLDIKAGRTPRAAPFLDQVPAIIVEVGG